MYKTKFKKRKTKADTILKAVGVGETESEHEEPKTTEKIFTLVCRTGLSRFQEKDTNLSLGITDYVKNNSTQFLQSASYTH